MRKPWLRDTHIGYYRIVLSIVAAHLALGVDSFLPGRHTAVVFTFVRPLQTEYGIMHFVVAVVITAALVTDERWWRAARWMFFISLLTFNTYAVGMIFAAAYLGGSFIGPIGLIALSISSAAAWREPTGGPVYRSVANRAS